MADSPAVFSSLDGLLCRLQQLGATRVLCKPLVENDNTKQQVYLGGNFEVLRLLPYRDIRTEQKGTRPNFKADLSLFWIDAEDRTARAPEAKLILYPDYPEVRFSGFLRGCPIAPSLLMQPTPGKDRIHSKKPDGRELLFGVSNSGQVLAYLAAPGSNVALEIQNRRQSGKLKLIGVFSEILFPEADDSKLVLLSRLREIHRQGWHPSQKLNREGRAEPYAAQNGGGYTLEALFGVKPNGDAVPDFLGWELKAYSQGRVTLMTPEPDVGYYGSNGVESFVRRYGHACEAGVLYFTGTHKVNVVCGATTQTLMLEGFDSASGKILDVGGGIFRWTARALCLQVGRSWIY